LNALSENATGFKSKSAPMKNEQKSDKSISCVDQLAAKSFGGDLETLATHKVSA
jgi:hypothetical protein